MTFSDTTMMELGIKQSTNIHKTRSLIRTLKHVLDILQTEEAFMVEEYKNTHTHTHTHTHKTMQLHMKKLKLDIFICAPQRKLFPMFSLSSPGRGIFSKSALFEN